jgi:hypothetical protein
VVPGLAFKFDYIAPQHHIVQQLLREKCPTCNPSSVPGSGPAPVLMRFSDLRAATPLWEELSLWIENNKPAKDALGEQQGACTLLAWENGVEGWIRRSLDARRGGWLNSADGTQQVSQGRAW